MTVFPIPIKYLQRVVDSCDKLGDEITMAECDVAIVYLHACMPVWKPLEFPIQCEQQNWEPVLIFKNASWVVVDVIKMNVALIVTGMNRL